MNPRQGRPDEHDDVNVAQATRSQRSRRNKLEPSFGSVAGRAAREVNMKENPIHRGVPPIPRNFPSVGPSPCSSCTHPRVSHAGGSGPCLVSSDCKCEGWKP